jgi:ligand-binding sensor domain-containing protein
MEGFIWITTYGDGIVRYNSVDFKSYNQGQNTDKRSLSSSIVFSIFQDSQKNIWAGTELGLNIYNNKLDKFENIDLDGKKQKFPIHAITEYDENTLLLGTHENGLHKLDKNTLESKVIKYQEKKPLKNLQINTIVKSSNGRFLIGTNHGLLTFDPYDEILQLAKFNTRKGYETIGKSIESMVIGKDNSIWIGTSSSGLYKITNNDDFYFIEKFSITRKRILSLAKKTNGNILCGTENDGLFEINYKTKKVINYQQDKLNNRGVKSNSIWTVFTDDKNRIWLGYYNQGIDVHDDNYNKFNTIESSLNLSNSLNKNSVTGIVKDRKGRFWISMFDGGVDVYDPEEKVFVNLFNQKNNISKGLDRLAIPTIFIDSHDNVWVGTWESGLFLLKNKSNKFVNINMTSKNSVFKSNRIMSFDEDSNGTIWIGTFLSGLYSYDPVKEIFKHHDSPEFKKYNINTSNIRKVLVDHDDNIWLGSRTGLFKVESSLNDTFKVSSLNKEMNADLEANFNDSIIPSIVFSIFEDSKNNLWIGTLGDGLSKYNIEEKSFKRYDKNTGLIHETVFSLTEDHRGAIWIGGNNGLTKLNPKRNTFINFSKKDGLLSNSFNYNAVYKDVNNVLYFGSSRGINYFNPDEINYNQEKPIVYLSNLMIFNDLIKPDNDQSPLKEVISKTKELVLNHSQKVFTIDYVGINYTRSKNNQYAYFLEGYDNEWNYVETTRSATYKNIPAGDYTFMVKSSNNDGIWNNTPTTLKIKIQPAWWSTKMAIVSYCLMVLLLGYFIYKFLNTRIEEKRILQLERQEYKQFEALNAKKYNFLQIFLMNLEHL